MTEKNILEITLKPFETKEELENMNQIHNVSDEINEKIINVFNYYKINNKCIALFGDWAINEAKDIVNISSKCNIYPLFFNNPHLETENEIFNQLSSKEWFNAYQRVNLFRALTYIGIIQIID